MSNNRHRTRAKCRRLYGEDPENVNGQMASRTEFYKEELFRIIKGLFEIDFDVSWNDDYFLEVLLTRGYIVITDTSAGIIPIRASLTGINYNDFPTKVIGTLPILGDFERTLGQDAQIVYLEWKYKTRTFFNFITFIRIFAERLASCDCGIDVNIMNSRLAYIAEAESRAQADSIKYMFDRVSNGEPLVVYRANSLSGNPLNLLFNNLKNNFIVPDLLDAKRTIMNEFLTMLGVNNANTDKRERLISSEVNSNNEELIINQYTFERNLAKCVKLVKKMYPGIKFSIKLKFDSRTREEMRQRSDDLLRSSTTMGSSASNN